MPAVIHFHINRVGHKKGSFNQFSDYWQFLVSKEQSDQKWLFFFKKVLQFWATFPPICKSFGLLSVKSLKFGIILAFLVNFWLLMGATIWQLCKRTQHSTLMMMKLFVQQRYSTCRTLTTIMQSDTKNFLIFFERLNESFQLFRMDLAQMAQGNSK